MTVRHYTLRPDGGKATRQTAPVAAPVTAPARPSQGTLYPDTRTQALSDCEVKELGMVANTAWRAYLLSEAEAFQTWRPTITAAEKIKHTVQRLAAEANSTQKEVADYWRHGQVFAATERRCRRLRDLKRSDFRAVKAHFLHLAGMTEQAFALHLRTGRAGSRAGAAGDVVETVEQADRAIAAQFEALVRHFATQGAPATARERAAAYLADMVAPKERKAGCGWRSWPAKGKWQIYWTLKNRLGAMQGTGSTANRNKSQRRQP